jgi:uncharacterized LabA/DUF88 family protein
MGISYAVLLDGGFLRHKLSSRASHLDARRVCSFTDEIARLPCLAGMRKHRIYYYDSRPLETVEKPPLGGRVVNFRESAVAKRGKALHAALVREPHFALRFGELQLEGWRVRGAMLRKAGTVASITADDLEPDIRQKGVDMRIGLDIASLTLKKQANVIVLVTGDSDFIPAMKFARREGAQLVLLTLGHNVREGMWEHADMVIDRYPLDAK